MCAVLVSDRNHGIFLRDRFSDARIPAQFMHRQNVDVTFRGIKIVTRHTAKGLEFPIVALSLTDSWQHDDGERDERNEATLRERRLNHMAMTRAMRSLLVTLPPSKDEHASRSFTAPLWNVETVTSE